MYVLRNESFIVFALIFSLIHFKLRCQCLSALTLCHNKLLFLLCSLLM